MSANVINSVRPKFKFYVHVSLAVPSEPPLSVTAGVINATSAWIRWKAPPVYAWNGEISGYLVKFFP